MTMGTWKTKVIRKKGRGSQTTGRAKGIIATTLSKFICRRNRSYKDRLYSEWCVKYDGNKIRNKA